MIEIFKTDSRRNEKTKIKSKKKSPKIGGNEKPFTAQLQKTISFEFSGSLEELIFELKDQEKRFLDSESFYELNKYKAIVKKILETVLRESFETRTLKRTKRNFADFTVQKIDSKLLEITSAITKKNKAFDLLKTIDEIRGLIFDLLY